MNLKIRKKIFQKNKTFFIFIPPYKQMKGERTTDILSLKNKGEMNMKRIIAMGLAILMAFSFCACGEEGAFGLEGNKKDALVDDTIHLNDYVSVTPGSCMIIDGVEHLSEAYVCVNVTKMYEDNLDKVIGFYTRDDIMDAVNGKYYEETFRFEYPEDYKDRLKDGEEIHMTWKIHEESLANLKTMFHEKVEFVYEDFSFTVKCEPTNLGYKIIGEINGESGESLMEEGNHVTEQQNIEPLDLRQNVHYIPAAGNVEKGWTLFFVTSYVKLPTGENVKLKGYGRKADESVAEIGDVVTVDFTSSAKKYVAEYGEELFKSLIVDIPIEYLPYLPDEDRAEDAFKYMDETCCANMEYALGRVLSYTMGQENYEAADMTVEQIGMMLYYMDPGNKMTGFEGNEYNQLIAVYKIVNADNPNGFYTFLGYNGDMYICKEFDKATGMIRDCVYDINAAHLEKDFRYYKNELPKMNKNAEVPVSFEKNGVTYPGHESLEELILAINKNIVKNNHVDHLIVTDGLKAFVAEY